MRIVRLIVFLWIASFTSKAQNYNTENILVSLKNRANAVIRNSKTVVDMRSPDNVLMSVSKAVTVLNKGGEIHGQLVLFYDKNISIRSVKGEIYDEFGKQTGKLSMSNLKDESAVNDFSLFEDSRVKYYIPQINTYPYTIVYQYEIRNKQNLITPQWKPVPGFDVAVEKSTYQFISNPKDEIRVHVVNYKGNPTEENTEKQKSLLWAVSEVNAVKHEAYAPNQESYFTSVKVAPKNFNYYNFKGSYTDWEGLGKLSYDYLLKDRRTLLPQTVEHIKDLVKDETNDKAKAKKIYEYFQNRTRYISVQIGIGGFQPIRASEVDRLGYGDCKGLVNYMQSLLDVVGIESYYCVVDAGEEKTDLIPSFASMEQGNHIILCLPLKGDTTWLECTSQDAPFGYLGSFTDDRWVLACTKDGGKLLKTPKFEALKSPQIRTANLMLHKDGTVSGSVATKFEGGQFDNHYSLIHKSGIDKEKQLKRIYDINNIEFKNIELEANKDIPAFKEKFTVDIKNYATINNDKIFITPNLFNVKRTVPTIRNRTKSLDLKRGYLDIDSLSISLDEGIIPIILPKSVKIDTKFGVYELQIKLMDRTLIYYRKLLMKDGLFEAQDYEAYENFVNEVSNNDRLRLALSLKK